MKDMTDADIIAANKQRARDYFKAFATQDKDWLEANVAPTYIRQDTTLPFEVKGPEGVLALGDVLLGAFSEVELDIQEERCSWTTPQDSHILLTKCHWRHPRH